MLFPVNAISMVMETGFGWVRIGVTTYQHDIVIHADGTISKRKKKASKQLKAEYAHTPLSDSELDILERERPERVYIGTGQYGGLPLTPEAISLLEGYRSVIQPTPDVIRLIEDDTSRYLAILHVTC